MSIEHSAIRNVPARQFNASALFYLCIAESPEGSTCGVLRNLCICAQISVDPPSYYFTWLQQTLQSKHGVTIFHELYGLADSHWGLQGIAEDAFSEAVCDAASVMHLTDRSLVFIDGRPVGSHRSAYTLVWQLREARRTNMGLGNIYTSISHSHDYQCVYLTTNSGRALQPLLVVDPATQRVKLQHEQLHKSIHWLTNNGYLEFLDEQEVETLTVALTVGDLYHWKTKGGPFTHIVPHPSLCYSLCSNWGCFQNHTMSARNVVH